jgi:hypothetical protein
MYQKAESGLDLAHSHATFYLSEQDWPRISQSCGAER